MISAVWADGIPTAFLKELYAAIALEGPDVAGAIWAKADRLPLRQLVRGSCLVEQFSRSSGDGLKGDYLGRRAFWDVCEVSPTIRARKISLVNI